MKFGKTLREQIIQEWRFYAVDYKTLKKTLSMKSAESANIDEFYGLLDDSKNKLSKFYFDKEAWAKDYMHTLEERVKSLRETCSEPACGRRSEFVTSRSDASLSSSCSDISESSTEPTETSPKGTMDLALKTRGFQWKKRCSNSGSWLKDEYRRVGHSKHFQSFIYAKKSLATFDRELDLLLEFLELNATAFSKILKKFDKRTGLNARDEYLADLHKSHAYLEGDVLRELQERVTGLIDEVNALKPSLPQGWEDRKVYTIGCFDLFHRGHQNVLLSLREFGYYIVAGIHDDESYFKLKNKYTIDNLETRMNNVKPFVDQLYVIPSTDPLLYIKSMVSDQDIETGSCCYARGDDMLNFPGRDWVESVMPVHFVPRTESCSSSLIRTIYHADDESLREKAAFAKTRYDGKPVDEEGNVLK
jgi:cytidyltransferase-like protein